MQNVNKLKRQAAANRISHREIARLHWHQSDYLKRTDLAIELRPKDDMSGARNFRDRTGKYMVDRSLFIEAMRHVAQSVTVVTTQGDDGPTGATVSAFSSLSADPPSVWSASDPTAGLVWPLGATAYFA